MFDLVVQLTGGGPGNLTTLTSIDLKRRSLRALAHRLRVRLRGDPVRHGFRAGFDLCKGAQQGEGTMSGFSITEPSPAQKWIAGTLVVGLRA